MSLLQVELQCMKLFARDTMFRLIKDYIKKEILFSKGKPSFYIIKIVLVLVMLGVLFYGESLGNEKNIIYWSILCLALGLGVSILLISHLGKRFLKK